MTNHKHTKRALLSSMVSLVLCFAMLLGTTFAWFTDTASTNVNTILAGTLDVKLLDEKGNSLESQTLSWQTADNHNPEDILWEPGVTFNTDKFQIKNTGNLALKYQIILNGVNGDAGLLEVIDFKVVKSDGTTVDLDKLEGNLTSGETSDAYYITATMKKEAGNGYQGKTLKGISITVLATQWTHEDDSNGNDYDQDAEYSTANVNTTAMLITAGNLTIDENLSIDSSETNANSDVIRITGGDHVITGGNYTAYGNKSNSCVRVDGGNVTIKNGNFEAKGDNTCIYAAGGNITIEGGTFKSENTYANRYWVLNAKDYSGSVITVKGGSFYKFDPSNANTGKGEIVIADGYKVEQDGEWYKVVAE